MKLRKSEWILLGITAISALIGIWAYPRLPESVAGHWNSAGEVDGYLSKFWGLAIMPLVTAFLAGLFIALPRIDPLKANIVSFRKYFDGFIIVLGLFLLGLYLFTIAWNLGYQINIIRVLSPAFALLIYFTGILCQNAKQNWFIGIKTPWTLSNEVVWNKTHRLCGALFKYCGAIALFGMVFERFAIALIIVPIISVAVFSFIYSYLVYRRETESE